MCGKCVSQFCGLWLLAPGESLKSLIPEFEVSELRLEVSLSPAFGSPSALSLKSSSPSFEV